MQRRAIAVLLAGLASCLSSVPAGAQSGFAGAAIGVDVERFPHQSSSSPSISANDISGSARSWSIAGGATIRRHAVLQAEFASTRETTTDIPPTQYIPPCPSCGTTQSTVRYRTERFTVLGGYTAAPWRRVRLSALGGLVFAGQWTRTTSVYTPLPPSPAPRPSDYTYTQYVLGPALGFDAPTTAWDHVQVVPQVRLYKLASGPLIVNLSVGARWAF